MKNKAITTVLLTAMLVAGCNDGTMAPKQDAGGPVTFSGGTTATLTSLDTTYFHFVIDPKKSATFALGDGNSIFFPKASVCDPNSTYGVTEWDKPCNVAVGTITIDAKGWLDSTGAQHLDFAQHIRFVPAAEPKQMVTLSFTNMGIATSPWGGKILYCVTELGCYDESLTDPSLVTTTDPKTGIITRRVKHFSGYSLTAGRDDEAALNKIGLALIKP
jgi:hypothetical protein